MDHQHDHHSLSFVIINVILKLLLLVYYQYTLLCLHMKHILMRQFESVFMLSGSVLEILGLSFCVFAVWYVYT